MNSHMGDWQQRSYSLRSLIDSYLPLATSIDVDTGIYFKGWYQRHLTFDIENNIIWGSKCLVIINQYVVHSTGNRKIIALRF